MKLLENGKLIETPPSVKAAKALIKRSAMSAPIEYELINDQGKTADYRSI